MVRNGNIDMRLSVVRIMDLWYYNDAFKDPELVEFVDSGSIGGLIEEHSHLDLFL
jgi:hypothetical protein